MGIGNFHIGIMGNLFSGKTTLMNALTSEPYRAELQALFGGAELYSFTERVEKEMIQFATGRDASYVAPGDVVEIHV